MDNIGEANSVTRLMSMSASYSENVAMFCIFDTRGICLLLAKFGNS